MSSGSLFQADLNATTTNHTLNETYIETYVTMACLGALAWDILSNIPKDYLLVTNYTIRLPTTVYFISRIATMSFVLTSAAYLVAPVESRGALLLAIGWSNVFALSSSSFLFFLRVKAIYDRTHIIAFIFGILWLGNAGTSIVTPFSLTGDHIPGTKRCINTAVKSFCSATFIFSAVYDSLVFIAVSCRFYYLNPKPVRSGVRGRVRQFLGKDLPFFSRALLQGGQIYYLITVSTNIAVMVAFLSPSITAPERPSFAIPKITIDNIMACLVFRNLKLGYYLQGIDDVKSPEFNINAHGEHSIPLHWRRASNSEVGTQQGQEGVLELSAIKFDRSFGQKGAEINVIEECNVKGDSINEPCNSTTDTAE